jgi:hypothetical protein
MVPQEAMGLPLLREKVELACFGMVPTTLVVEVVVGHF